MHSRLLLSLVAMSLVVAACSSSSKQAADAVVAAPTTTTSTTTSTTTTSTTTTTTIPPEPITELIGDIGPGMRAATEAFYNYIHDPTRKAPRGVSPDLLDHVTGYSTVVGRVAAEATQATLSNGDGVAVVTTETDAVLLLQDGTGWHVVAALLDGLEPWLGEADLRTLLVLGTDARVGENQLGLRADSVHILTMVPATGDGTFLGFPRDSWIRGSKLTNLMPLGGTDLMMDVITEVSGLEPEGWIAVGFEGFLGLMDELGPLAIDLPTTMRSGNNWDNYPAGLQVLDSQLVLRLARIRKGLPRGDFDRTINQGLITQAAMLMIQDLGISELPRWVAALDEHGFTDLETEALFTFAATAFVSSPEQLTNLVVPAVTGTVGSASVVFIVDSAEEVFRDLDDGVIDQVDS